MLVWLDRCVPFGPLLRIVLVPPTFRSSARSVLPRRDFFPSVQHLSRAAGPDPHRQPGIYCSGHPSTSLQAPVTTSGSCVSFRGLSLVHFGLDRLTTRSTRTDALASSAGYFRSGAGRLVHWAQIRVMSLPTVDGEAPLIPLSCRILAFGRDVSRWGPLPYGGVALDTGAFSLWAAVGPVERRGSVGFFSLGFFSASLSFGGVMAPKSHAMGPTPWQAASLWQSGLPDLDGRRLPRGDHLWVAALMPLGSQLLVRSDFLDATSHLLRLLCFCSRD